MDKASLFIFTVLILAVGMLLGMYLEEKSIEPIQKENITECDNLVIDCDFKQAALEVANLKPYVRDVWDCSDMTNRLVIDLRGLGYNANSITGIRNTKKFCLKDESCGENRYCVDHNCWGLHAWTRIIIDIESTSGRIITKRELRYDYKEDW